MTRRNIIIALCLAAVINAGVLLALPLLGGAIETAMPVAPVYNVYDIELMDIDERLPAPILRSAVSRNKVPVEPEKQPPPPGPDKPPEKPRAAPGKRLPDLLQGIDIDIDPGVLSPDVDLILPDTGISGTIEATGTGKAKEVPPEKKLWSLDEVDRMPVKTHDVEPLYPRWALEQEVEGTVTLGLVIGADGTVSSVRILESSGYTDFDNAAKDALRRWRFAPALSGGKAVAVRASQKIRFSLR